MKAPYTYVKIFRNTDTLAHMLQLKAEGVSTSSLSRTFHCTRNAIMYRCRVSTGEIAPRPRKGRKSYPYKEIIEDENPNRGHRYRDYLKKVTSYSSWEDEQIALILAKMENDQQSQEGNIL